MNTSAEGRYSTLQKCGRFQTEGWTISGGRRDTKERPEPLEIELALRARGGLRHPHPGDEYEVKRGEQSYLDHRSAERHRQEVHRHGSHEQPREQRVGSAAREAPAELHRHVLPPLALALVKDLQVSADP